MNAETLDAMTDIELRDLMKQADAKLTERAETRRRDAMEKIREIASSVRIQVNFRGLRRRVIKASNATLKAGEKYQNPTEPEKIYVVGKGRPPAWFEELRAKGRLPAPVQQ